MSSAKSICVFCGSRNGRDAEIVKSTERFAQNLALAGHQLVYGGGSLGLMGVMAKTCVANGGSVLGIIPESLRVIENAFCDGAELLVTPSMHTRKQLMFEKSDAFVVLPGGLGTLDEVVEIASWRNLSFHEKPIIIANVNNYWAPLIKLLEHFEDFEFVSKDLLAKTGHDALFHVVDDLEDILPTIDQLLQAGAKKS